MDTSTKKMVAREWLTFVAALIVGLTIAPIAILAAFEKDVQLSKLGGFYEALFSQHAWYIAWLIALSPYLIYQLVRSLRWALRITREH